MTTPRLAEMTVDNVGAACRLTVAPHQRDCVAPVLAAGEHSAEPFYRFTEPAQ